MTVEHLWINNNIIKADNWENKDQDHQFQYDPKDNHFDLLRKCAVMNSTAVFTISLPNDILDQLENKKKHDP